MLGPRVYFVAVGLVGTAQAAPVEPHAAATLGMDAYQSWWQSQPPEFRKAAVRTQTHADMKEKACEVVTEPTHAND